MRDGTTMVIMGVARNELPCRLGLRHIHAGKLHCQQMHTCKRDLAHPQKRAEEEDRNIRLGSLAPLSRAWLQEGEKCCLNLEIQFQGALSGWDPLALRVLIKVLIHSVASEPHFHILLHANYIHLYIRVCSGKRAQNYPTPSGNDETLTVSSQIDQS